MNITIAGYGFVGKAHNELLQEDHQINIVDPAYAAWNFPIADDTQGVIVCVATPQREDGTCEMQNVYDVIDSSPDVPILIKSTISVEGWNILSATYPDRTIAFSPEFLREASWREDIMNLNKLLIGGKGCNFWKDVFCINTEVCDAEALILAKYARNSFLALKVAFFNQMYDLCEALEVDYEAVAEYTGMDERITQSHTKVTEQRGFGGHCFPKDTSALVESAQNYNVNLSILEEAINYNKRIRS